MRTSPILHLALALAVSLASAASPVDAQLFDHLKCYKVKDPAKFKADATLDALQAEFGSETCKVLGKATLACGPVDEVGIENFVDQSPGLANRVELDGVDLRYDRICYKIKCPKAPPTDLEMTDQFGTRALSKLKAHLVCTPAVHTSQTTSTTTTTITTTTTTTTIPQSPTPTILAPADGSSHTAGVGISFIGEADDLQDGALAGASLVWTSDVLGLIGFGTAFNAAISVTGTHEITLTAIDSDTNQKQATITLHIVP